MSQGLTHPLVVRLLRALAVAVGLVLLAMGIGFFVMPEVLASALLAAEPARAVGINSLRGDFGGLFLGLAAFTLAGALSRHRWLLLVPTIFHIAIVAGRLTSVIVDDLPLVVGGALAVELAFLAVLGLNLLSAASLDPQRPDALALLADLRVLGGVALVALAIILALRNERAIGLALVDAAARGRMGEAPFAALPDGLHVGLAGTGAPLPDARRRGASTFVRAGTHWFLVDAGPGSTLTLELMKVPLPEVEAVLLTHLHSDHMGALGELLLKAWTRGARTRPMPIWGPEGVETLVEGFNRAYTIDASFRIAHHGDTIAPASGFGGQARTLAGFGADQSMVVYEKDGVKITAFLVDHLPVEPALGYRFDYQGRSVVISGDTLPNETLRQQAEGVDLLLHEVLQPDLLTLSHRAAVREGLVAAAKLTEDIRGYHTFPEEVARVGREAHVRHLVFHHFLPPVPVRELNAAFLGDAPAIFQGPITMGIEGMMFSLPVNSDAIELGWRL